MSPRPVPRPGTRYRVVVTEITDDGSEVTYDHAGDAHLVAVATQRGNNITGDLDHDGDAFLRHRLVAYINDVATRI